MVYKVSFNPSVSFILKWRCTKEELIESLRDVETYDDARKVLEENMIVEYLPRPRRKAQ